jgi:Xaa-Pro aminopeptidase
MFQSFESAADPKAGPGRLAALRARMADAGLAGFIVPRADAHQGEYVAAHDERLQWLTGFTGSAGFCIVLPQVAGVFIDGRYRTQVKAQVDLAAFTPVPWPEVKPGDWIRNALAAGVVGFDPWLHTAKEIDEIALGLAGSDVRLEPVTNLVDAIWTGQPAPPAGRVVIQPLDLAGEAAGDKRRRLAGALAGAGHSAVVLTLPDSISWLLNIRGSDVARNPVVHGFAVLHRDGSVDLYSDPGKYDGAARAHLGDAVRLLPPSGFGAGLRALSGPVQVDRATAPLAVSDILKAAGIEVVWGEDPCILPKACKNPVEVAGAAEAHLRDGAAMVEFMAWFDMTAPGGGLTEMDVVTALEGHRRATNALREISFDTICGSGPHGAVIHYRVTKDTNRAILPGDIVVIDSGGQYADGTTDVTRTVAVGPVGVDERAAFTRVLQGMIALSRLRWPVGLAGAHIDALARVPLWLAGQDYNHGTGHGVGSYLSVHEGPARISRLSDVPLQPGMILSNEPGYYREGAFGIRIENLLVVESAPSLPGGDAERAMLRFRTLTFVPIDARLIDVAALNPAERDWLDNYHAEVFDQIGPRVSPEARAWLSIATAPLGDSTASPGNRA